MVCDGARSPRASELSAFLSISACHRRSRIPLAESFPRAGLQRYNHRLAFNHGTSTNVSMTREPIIESGGETPGEDENQLRPHRLHDMIGQQDVIERLAIAVDAALKRDETLGHVLFDGPPGLGKTTLALCIPREMDANVFTTTAAALRKPGDLVPYLSNLHEGAVLFIDEIHRLPHAVEEYLYPAMEDFRIDIILGEGVNARTISMQLKPFTLIGATTRAGMLTAPLRDRFQIREHLDFYPLDQLTRIVNRSAAKLNMDVPESAAVEIAGRSRSTPRIANNRLRWIRDYADSRNAGQVDKDVAVAAMEMAGVDQLGLDKLDRQYLDTLIRVLMAAQRDWRQSPTR